MVSPGFAASSAFLKSVLVWTGRVTPVGGAKVVSMYVFGSCGTGGCATPTTVDSSSKTKTKFPLIHLRWTISQPKTGWCLIVTNRLSLGNRDGVHLPAGTRRGQRAVCLALPGTFTQSAISLQGSLAEEIASAGGGYSEVIMVNWRGVCRLQAGFSCAEGDSYGQAWIFISRGSKRVTVRIRQRPIPLLCNGLALHVVFLLRVLAIRRN
jgi:hypothetical protein